MTTTGSDLSFREAMSCLGAAVNVVTSAGSAGRLGFTATAVCSVSDQPPTLIVCMNRSSAQNEGVKSNGVLCVNTLSHEQQDLGAVFAGMTQARSEERFLGASWSTLATGAPVLHGSLASFDCEIERVIEVGTHSVFVCSVLDVATNRTGESLVYFRRRYCATQGFDGS
ncbi:flavin reductase [Methylobacterium brachythecii]|uniref:FMN reductase (NADH) RutF n=1 Tax=Methylobacterium brachythecii TaxID=1176177 RepID=A0A7W6F7P9_9HYPH|nr:flavin reductase [Methylobacterium brachythecii]MBB3903697.1 flavin reductase [Methylobacterium brachythecii]GLS44268.1 FMN reductase (NADH) RutF [Methylobacterium brachythecii]